MRFATELAECAERHKTSSDTEWGRFEAAEEALHHTHTVDPVAEEEYASGLRLIGKAELQFLVCYGFDAFGTRREIGLFPMTDEA